MMVNYLDLNVRHNGDWAYKITHQNSRSFTEVIEF